MSVLIADHGTFVELSSPHRYSRMTGAGGKERPEMEDAAGGIPIASSA
jgi:hypothetical protein